jgi:hypothetical protein
MFCQLSSSSSLQLRLFPNDTLEGCDLLKSCHVAAAQNFEWVLMSLSTSVEREERKKLGRQLCCWLGFSVHCRNFTAINYWALFSSTTLTLTRVVRFLLGSQLQAVSRGVHIFFMSSPHTKEHAVKERCVLLQHWGRRFETRSGHVRFSVLCCCVSVNALPVSCPRSSA